MKVLFLLIVFLFSGFVFAESSCKDVRSCAPTQEDKQECIDYVVSATGRDGANVMLDITNACQLNFGSSCVKYLTTKLKRTDLNNVLDSAKACQKNYSKACIQSLLDSTWTRPKNTVLDFTRVCRQNDGGDCVAKRIADNNDRTDDNSLMYYAKSCQIFNRGLNP